MKIRERGRNKKKKGKKGAADLEPRLLQNKRKRDASKRGGIFISLINGRLKCHLNYVGEWMVDI